ncbi:MAG: UDP-N-acetyl-D-glucosamine dehydrogenase [Nitrospirae bacterium RIFCSPLOW2_12_42_9]|nr:MAG: UDP-N-acetyl-D-glucosamine dehydrogenase [Nitrospirae bacterium RIFCSPLOW2_12_42_9]HBI24228.1 nucleotide sugar dehydrogenase [Nitrospiraceae bacterium]
MIYKELISKIENRSARIGIIGLGYVGLPLVLRFCEEGFKVIGFDVDPRKIENLNQGRSYIKHIPSEAISRFSTGGIFHATLDMSQLKNADAIIICVPTPLTDKREPDMRYVEGTTQEIAKWLRKGHLISLESTTYPGTTEEILLPLFQKKGLKVGEDFFLVFSPEREDPANPQFHTRTIPKVVGGVTQGCLNAGTALYSKIIEKVVPVSSTRAAEATKLLENIYRSINIAMVNELKMLFDRMGIDVWEVIEAAKTKPFGFQPFYPGPGLGGHCIPIDPFYLTWKAREYDFQTRFIELAGEINTFMPYYVVQKIMDALNEHGKAIRGSKILVLGAAYKKDVDDMRESPSLHVIELLMQKGALVDYNDPYVPKLPEMRKHKLEMESVELSEETLGKYDCVVIATNHTSYDYKWIVDHAKLVVDTRNAAKDIQSDKIRKA